MLLELEEEIYQRFKEFLLESKFFRRGDECLRYHLVYKRKCKKCKKDKCDTFDYYYDLRFDAILHYLLDAATEVKFQITPFNKLFDETREKLGETKNFAKLLEHITRRVDNDIKLYYDVHSLNGGCDPEKCTYENCEQHKEMMKYLWPLFLDEEE